MSTRGILGFRSDGIDKLTYNHSDSYPSGLGVDVVNQIPKLLAIPGLRSKVNAIQMVSENKSPTKAQKKKLAKLKNLNVGNQSDNDWYCLLREAQGDLLTYVEHGFMIENSAFVNDSLFCEWGYIVNLDTSKLEIYRGFQESPHKKGRFADGPGHQSGCGDKYYPIALVAEIPFDKLSEKKLFKLEA